MINEGKNMNEKEIEQKMHEFANLINKEFNDIKYLAEAMKAKKIKRKVYTNENLAFVGDAILKFVLADTLYEDNKKHNKGKMKGDLTKDKEKLENSAVLYRVMKNSGWCQYCNNGEEFYDINKKDNVVVFKKHDPYVEAIIAAIYYDSGYESARKWILEILKPLLEKYK